MTAAPGSAPVFDAILIDHSLIPQVLEALQLIPSLREWLTELVS